MELEAVTIRYYTEHPESFIGMNEVPFPEIYADAIEEWRSELGSDPLLVDIGYSNKAHPTIKTVGCFAF